MWEIVQLCMQTKNPFRVQSPDEWHVCCYSCYFKKITKSTIHHNGTTNNNLMNYFTFWLWSSRLSLSPPSYNPDDHFFLYYYWLTLCVILWAVLAETLATLGVHRTVGAESICDVLLSISTEMHVTIRPPGFPPPPFASW
jgi:hypothetical protein